MITIDKTPYGFMGSNMEHYFTCSSTNTALTNFKYVVDIYFNPYESTAEKIGRVKLRPNTYGKAIFDIRDIIKNYIKPNPRAEETYNGISGGVWNIDINNPNGNFGALSGFSPSNIYNFTNPYELLQHTGSYRILVGEEYTSGGTTVLDIQTKYWIPTDIANFTYSLDTVSAGYSGTPNRINWQGANSWDYGTSYGTFVSGATYLHTTFAGSFVASGSSTADSGFYVAGSLPTNNDIVYLWSNDLGCGYKFIWNCDGCETTGWNYYGLYYSESNPICVSASDLIRLTPAADVSYYRNLLGDNNSTLLTSTEYMGKFKLSTAATGGVEYLEDNAPLSNFYNKFGNDRTPYAMTGITISAAKESVRFRHRQHHKQCPVLVNFAQGNLGYDLSGNANINQVSNLVELRQTANVLEYHATHQLPYQGTTSNVYTDLDYLITNFAKYYYGVAEFDDVKKVAFYTTSSGSPVTDFTSYGSSNIYVFDFYGDECLYGDAVHFLYLNTNGAWDTITFGQKNIKSLSTSRDVYAQTGVRDASSYMWQSSDQRNIVYNQDTVVSVEAQSIWMDDNDMETFRDFFLSNYAYQIISNIGYNNILFYTLVPILVTNSTFEEYKQRYNKLYQYTMNYVYNPINQFNTSI